jgi:uncharacterized protein (TIGR00725 family)
MSDRQRILGVIGSGNPDSTQQAVARAVGEAVARRGAHLVCGGLGGVMAAACQGLALGRARHATGSLALGILPGDEAASANEWVDLALPTGLGIARNVLVVRAAQAVVVVGGESGTLSELALAWQLGKRLVAVRGTGGFADELAGRSLDSRPREPIWGVDDAEAAVALALGEQPPPGPSGSGLA